MLNDRANFEAAHARYAADFHKAFVFASVLQAASSRCWAVALFSSPLALERLSEASLHLSLIGRNRSNL